MLIVDVLQDLIGAAGSTWLAAVGVSFLASTCEQSNPAPKGEVKLGALGAVGGVASLVTPFLVFVHAYWSVTLKSNPVIANDFMLFVLSTLDNALIMALLTLFVVLTILPLLPGFLIRKTAPGPAAWLYRASPILHIIAFAVAAFAARESVPIVLTAFMSGAPPAATP